MLKSWQAAGWCRGRSPMKAFLAGLGAAVLIAVVAAVVSGVVDLQSKDVYQSHNGSVRVSAR